LRYIVVKHGGEESREETIKITELKDGRLQVIIGRKKVFINPLTAVGRLLGSIWPKAKT
jgi:hypothetical protein